MKKLIFSLVPVLFLQNALNAQEKPPTPESVEIVIKVEKQSEDVNPVNEVAWQTIVDTAITVARQCQDCTERTLDVVVNNVCECIKGMADTMKTNPCAKGCISITIKDPESGVTGSVRKK